MFKLLKNLRSLDVRLSREVNSRNSQCSLPDVPQARADTRLAETQAQAHANLLTTAALQRAIFNSANFSSIATDARGVIQIFNVGAERMLGYLAEDVVNQITPADISDPQEVILRAKTLSTELDTLITPGFEALVFKASRGIEDIYELTYIRKDGSRFPAVVSVTALRDDWDAIIGYLLIGTDNTEKKQRDLELEVYRHQLEELVRSRTLDLIAARDAAETANRSKADFLSNMSHEIRTPLNAILGLAYLLDKDPLDPQAHTRVKKIRSAGRTLLGLISEILDVSKIEAGLMVIEHAPFQLTDVLDNLKVALQVQAGAKNIEIDIDAPPEGVSVLVGDALRLEQVLLNLGSNALKFTTAGRVTLRISVLSKYQHCLNLRFSMQDTGIGIPPELQKSIFSAFTQADSSTTRLFGGTGLGLSICKQLVHLMGGEIGLSSSVGQGSDFWFTLPLQQVNANMALPKSLISNELEPLTHDALAGLRVLVVDDSEINRDVVQSILSGQGAVVKHAVNGRDAIDWLVNNPSAVDLVLMDVQMPVMDGMEATRHLRSLPQFDDLPIIALTAGVMQSQKDAAQAAGMTHFISKPFDVNDTVALILQLARPSSLIDDPKEKIDFALPRLEPEPALATDLKVINEVQGLKIWIKATVYQSSLERFAHRYADVTTEIQTLLTQNNRPAAASLAHKLAGVAANLALPETRVRAADVEMVLMTESDPAAALALLQEALEKALATIERRANP